MNQTNRTIYKSISTHRYKTQN